MYIQNSCFIHSIDLSPSFPEKLSSHQHFPQIINLSTLFISTLKVFWNCGIWTIGPPLLKPMLYQLRHPAWVLSILFVKQSDFFTGSFWCWPRVFPHNWALTGSSHCRICGRKTSRSRSWGQGWRWKAWSSTFTHLCFDNVSSEYRTGNAIWKPDF